MNDLFVLEKLKLKSFCKEENDKVSIEGAIFLTYSIDCKTILSALLSMFADDEQKNIIQRWECLLNNGMSADKSNDLNDKYSEIQEHVAFVCNDGYDKSIASSIYYYTKGMTYYFKPENGKKYSFHPKLFIVKFKRNGDTFFRFMIGSMNFVNSRNKELISIFDVQAYEDDGNGSRIQCNVLMELLNLKEEYCSYNIQNRQATKLCKVIENLKLNELYFDKEDMSRIVVFPSKDEELKDALKKSNKIFSPFLTGSMLEEVLNSGVSELYTMESELKKCGYVSQGEGDESTGKRIWVYEAKEGEKAFSHIKAYVTNDGIYIGSLNFTKSAFENNKELLVRVDMNDKLIDDLCSNYKCKTFYYKKEAVSKQDIHDSFREIARELSENLVQEIIYKNREWHCTLLEKSDYKINLDTFKDKLSECDEMTDDIKITIAPFLCKDLEIFLGTGLEWKIKNRIKIGDCFIFTLYVDGKRKAQFNYHVQTCRHGQEQVNDNSSESAMNMILYRLSEQLANKSVTSKTMTKEADMIEKGTIRKDAVALIRKSVPTLEELLKKNIEKENISKEDIQSQIARITQIEGLLYDSSMTEEEKKFLGFEQFNKRIIENLLEQAKCLLAELTGE